MNTLLLVIAFCACATWALSYTYPSIRLSHAIAHDAPRQTGQFELGDPNNPSFKLLILGDSIGAAFGITKLEESIGGMMANKLAEQYHVLYVNRAGLGLWISDIKREPIEGQWDMIAILVGSNDVLHGIEPTAFRKHCYDLADRLKQHTDKVVIAGPGNAAGLKLFPFWLRPILKKRQAEVARIFKESADRIDAAYANALEEPRLVRHLCRDNLHLNADGNRILYNFIWDKIEVKGWVQPYLDTSAPIFSNYGVQIR